MRASVNPAILQVMADVLNCPVLRIEVAKSAALGAALRAAHGFLKHSGEQAVWPAIVKGFSDPDSGFGVETECGGGQGL